jgi:hypothetical protein
MIEHKIYFDNFNRPYKFKPRKMNGWMAKKTNGDIFVFANDSEIEEKITEIGMKILGLSGEESDVILDDIPF